MRYSDLLSPTARLKTYVVRIKLRQPGYVQQIDTTVTARNPEQARRIIRKQYNDRNIIVGQPRELREDKSVEDLQYDAARFARILKQEKFDLNDPAQRRNYYELKNRLRQTLNRLDKLNQQQVMENFADGEIRGKSRPGRVKRSGASCQGSVTDLRARAKKYGGERGKMYHWCANMKAGRAKKQK